MSTEKAKLTLIEYGLSLSLGLEIEDYIKWKIEHITEETTNFERVRANLGGDLPLPWTSVQLYMLMCINPLYANRLKRTQILTQLAFSKCKHPERKFQWLINEWGMQIFFSSYFAICFS